MAEALAVRGVKVAVLDINPDNAQARVAEIERAGGEAKAFACDVMEEGQLGDVYQQVAGAWSPPDILINGAGGNTRTSAACSANPGYEGS